MTIEELYERLGNIIKMHKEEGREEYNKLPIYVAADISPRRRTYFPLEAISGGMLTIPSSLGPKQPRIGVTEMRTTSQSKVTVKV